MRTYNYTCEHTTAQPSRASGGQEVERRSDGDDKLAE